MQYELRLDCAMPYFDKQGKNTIIHYTTRQMHTVMGTKLPEEISPAISLESEIAIEQVTHKHGGRQRDHSCSIKLQTEQVWQ